MVQAIKKINSDKVLFTIISCAIFITTGNSLTDFSRFFILKSFIIILILTQLNVVNEIKSKLYSNKKEVVLISLLLISITTSYLLTPFKINDFAYEWLRSRYLHMLTDIFLFVFLFLYFFKKGINYYYLKLSILLPGLIYMAYLLFSTFYNSEVPHDSKQFIFFSGKRNIGMLLLILISFYLGYIYSKQKRFNKKFNYIVLIFFFTLIFLFNGRASIISSILIYLFVLFILFIHKKNLKTDLLNFIFCIGISFLLFQIISFYFLENKNLNSTTQTIRDYFYINDRMQLWKYALSIIYEYPIFGKGPGSFFITSFNDLVLQKGYFKTSAHTQPHNFLLQFLVEWGIVGTSLILYLLFGIFIKSMKFLINEKKYILLIPGLVILGLGTHGLVDGTFHHSTFTFYLILNLSILCVEIIRKTNLEK